MTSPTLVQHEILIFAQRRNVPAEHVYTLPTIFDKVAGVAQQPVRSIINQATYTNDGLADYIKEVAAQVA